MEQADESTLIADTFTMAEKNLTDAEKQRLLEQDKRLVPEFKARQLEAQAQRHWDLFYKRNETRFFKDRRWTSREFAELVTGDQGCVDANSNCASTDEPQKLLEVGCGVGNLIFPLIEEDEKAERYKYFYYACDFSPRAVEFVRSNPLYNEQHVHAFQCDITADTVHEHIPPCSLDVITMIFVLSAIHPDKFLDVVRNLHTLLKPGGVVLFRDYGRYDMAQLRFKPGHKIADNFYMRQDGTRSYYFSEQELGDLFSQMGFEILNNTYVHRRTMNVKENLDVPRIFLQSKFRKNAT